MNEWIPTTGQKNVEAGETPQVMVLERAPKEAEYVAADTSKKKRKSKERESVLLSHFLKNIIVSYKI